MESSLKNNFPSRNAGTKNQLSSWFIDIVIATPPTTETCVAGVISPALGNYSGDSIPNLSC